MSQKAIQEAIRQLAQERDALLLQRLTEEATVILDAVGRRVSSPQHCDYPKHLLPKNVESRAWPSKLLAKVCPPSFRRRKPLRRICRITLLSRMR